ncbi:MAG: hypothetical protein Q9163_002259 [Psora crenata]
MRESNGAHCLERRGLGFFFLIKPVFVLGNRGQIKEKFVQELVDGRIIIVVMGSELHRRTPIVRQLNIPAVKLLTLPKGLRGLRDALFVGLRERPPS